MAKRALVFEAAREGYGIEQIRKPMTVGELKAFREDFDDDTLFVLSHDNGYTYGSIDVWRDVTTFEEQEDGNASRYIQPDDKRGARAYGGVK